MSTQQSNNSEKQNDNSIINRQNSRYESKLPADRLDTTGELNTRHSPIQSAIEKEFNDPVLRETIQKFIQIANEEKSNDDEN